MKAIQVKAMLARAMRLALAVLLVMTMCVPTAYASYHASSIDSAFDASSHAEAAASGTSANTDKISMAIGSVQSKLRKQTAGTDLNSVWKAQENGLSASFTIAKGGTYYLSADLAASARLIVNAPGQVVTIKMNGHTLTLNGGGAAAQKTMLAITAAKSVSLDGASDGAASTIRSAGNKDVRAIACTASGCVLTMNKLTVQLSSKSVDQRDLHTHCVYASAGSVVMNDCTLSMDMGNQLLRNTSSVTNSAEAPSAAYAASGVTSMLLSNCKIDSIGTPALSVPDISDDTTKGNMYAVYSLASTTTVSGGSYKAESLRGNATCIYAKSLTVSPGVSTLSLKANAGQLATGILSQAMGSVKLNAPFNFGVDELYRNAALAEAALRSSKAIAPGGFVFGDCVPSGTYPVLVMPGDDITVGNAPGYHLGVFAQSTAVPNRTSLLAKLEDAKGSAGSSSLILQDSSSVCFKFDENKAAAQIVETGAYYASVDTAMSAVASGQTVRLLKDAGDVTLSKTGGVTLDLNGKAASSVEFSYNGEGQALRLKNGFVRGTRLVGAKEVAVYHRSPSSLVLEGVTVATTKTDADLYGIYAESGSGKVSLDASTKVDMTAMRSLKSGNAAYGIGMAPSDGPELAIKGASIAVRTPSADTAVYGIQSSRSACVSDNATVSVEGTTGSAFAAYVSGVFVAKASEFDTCTSGGATNLAGAVGLNPVAKTESVELDSCKLVLKSPVLNGSSHVVRQACVLGATDESDMSQSSVALILSGACSFTSASGVHLGLNLGGVRIGPDFSLASGDSTLSISQARQEGNVGFMAQGSAKVTGELANMFAPLEGSYYEGWKLAADDDGKRLVWYPKGHIAGKGLVSVNGAKPGYASLREALEHASSGDTLTLLGDLSESGELLVDENDLTLDLNGYALTVLGRESATAGDKGTGAALKYTGVGTFALKDSSAQQQGKLAIKVGSSREPDDGAVYQGIAVSGGGMLSVESGVNVQVDYFGGSATSASRMASVALRGVSVLSGRLDFRGKLDVSSASVEGAPGPMVVYGMFAQPGAADEATIDIASGSSIVVNGLSGAIATPSSYSADSTSAQVGVAGLREIEINPKADPDFYADIVRQFRISATYDDPADTSLRSAFGSFVYFAQPMTLDHEGKWYDGLCVWAFTDEVTGAAVGKMSSITPTHLFISAQYDTLPSACGVATGVDTAGKANVTVSGSVSVACAHGNAYALDANCATKGVSSWKCEGASLSVSADDAVHPVVQKRFDLRDFVKFSKSAQKNRVAYSTMTTSNLIDFEKPIARDISIAKGARFSLDGKNMGPTVGESVSDVDQGASYKMELPELPVVFTNVFDSSGQLQDEVVGSIEYGKTLGKASVQIPQPRDFTDLTSGRTYRFIGWCPYVSGATTAVVYSHSQLKDMKVTVDIDSVRTTGTLTLRAAYVVTTTAQHIVSFEVDDYTSVCVVDDGAHPLYTDANDTNSQYISPQKRITETGKAYEFAGWYSDANGNGKPDANETVYTGILPPATADVTYKAHWKSKWSTLGYRFYIKMVGSSGEFFNPGSTSVTASAEKTTRSIADSVSPIGRVVGYGGKLYTLLGWSTRSNDVEPLYGTEYSMPNASDPIRWASASLGSSYPTTYYGVYSTQDHLVDVTFKDDGATLATTRISSVKTVDAAFAQTGAKRPADKSEKMKFLGWACSADSQEAVDGAIATIDDMAGSTAGTLTLHSVYGDPPVCTIRLRSEDGLSVLYKVSVKSGNSVSAALESAEEKMSIPVQKGKYFSGWRTAAGKRYDLDAPVNGSMDLYASYRDIDVVIGADDLTAIVSSVSEQFWDAEKVRFELASCRQPQTAISTTMKTNSYSTIDHFDLRVYAVGADGVESVITGDFGTAALSFKVGRKYRKSTVRAFWMGWKSGSEALKISDGKSPDSKGVVTVNIGDYAVGDYTEGGNFSLGYVEGGAGSGMLSTRLSSALSGRGLSGLSLAALTPNGLSGSLAKELAGKSGNADIAVSPSNGGNGGEGGAEDAQQDALEELFAGWGSEAVSLVVLAALACLALVYGLWRLFVVRQRREEAEAEFVAISERYAEGITF